MMYIKYLKSSVKELHTSSYLVLPSKMRQIANRGILSEMTLFQCCTASRDKINCVILHGPLYLSHQITH